MSARVVGPVAVVSLGQAEVAVERGHLLPSGVDEATVAHLEGVGLVTRESESERPRPAPTRRKSDK